MNNKPFIYLFLAIILAFFSSFIGIQKNFAQQSNFVKSRKKLVKKTVIAAPVNLISESLPNKVRRIAQEEGVNLRLFESLISQESAGRMNATSYKGARCLTQLMPGTAQRYGLTVNSSVDERLNVDKCLRVGARYLRLQLDTFKDFRLALAAYNAGEGAVMKFGNRIPPYKETIQYVEKIGYRFTGQTGHGTAFAWNLPVAVNYSSQVYGGRVDFRRVKQINHLAELSPSNTPNQAVLTQPISDELPPTSKEEEKTLVKRTKVVLEDAPGRVPAASLFFWNKPNTNPK